MKTVLASFLGKGPLNKETNRFEYGEVKYHRGSFEKQTRFIQVAVAAYLEREGEQLDEVIIFATKEARKHQEKNLRLAWRQAELVMPLRFVDVADGGSQSEAESIFAKMIEKIPAGEVTLHFDVTHGFRIQPIIGLWSMEFHEALQKDFRLGEIFYGEFNSREILVLTEIARVRDWVQSIRQFKESGQLRLLASLAGSAQAAARRQSYPANMGALASKLGKFADYVEAAALEKAADFAKEVLAAIGLAESDTHVSVFLKPVLAELRELFDPICAKVGFRAQFSIIQWVAETGRLQLGLVLATEWLISVRMRHEDIYDADRRKEVSWSMSSRDAASGPLVRAFVAVQELRNSYSHAWMNRADLPKNPYETGEKQLRKAVVLMEEVLEEIGGRDD